MTNDRGLASPRLSPGLAPRRAAPIRLRRALGARGAAFASSLALVAQWLFLITLFVLPLDAYLTLPGHASGVFLSQVLGLETAGLVALALLVGWLAGQMPPLTLRWSDLLPLGLVLIAGGISLVGATSRAEALKGCLKIAVLLGIYVSARAIRNAPEIRFRALGVVLGSLVIVILLGFLQSRQSVADISAILLNIQRSTALVPINGVLRAEATFRYPNELAAYLLLALPLLAVCVVRIPWTLERGLCLVLLAVGLWLLVLTYTRGALIAALLVAPLLALLAIDWRALVRGGWRVPPAARWRVALFGGIIVIGLAGILVIGGSALASRLSSLLSLRDTGYSARLSTWHWAITAFLHRPLTGVGVNNLHLQPNAPVIDSVTGAHGVDAENLFLNVLAEMGVIGLAAVVLCLGGALRRSWRALRAKNQDWVDQTWHLGVFLGLCGVLVYGIGDPVLVSGQVTGMLCAIVGLVDPGAGMAGAVDNARPGATSPVPPSNTTMEEC